jgi:outer membrane receptor protein involved in Fe transport
MRRKNQHIGRTIGLALSGTALLALSTEAWSQMEEIIVTTRKREENLQEIPVAVQAITAEQIERQGITNLSDIVQQSSSVILDQGFSPQDQRIVIRGLSPTRGRQNVAVLIDDIDISSEAIGTSGGSLLINPQLFDLERVEIVKGPQNALYGRSAFAGAINYITKKPGDTFDASAGTDVGSDGQLMLKAGISGPIGDNLSAGVNGMIWNHDGFYTNSTTGGNLGGKDGEAIAGTLVWDVAEAVSITGRVEYLNDHFDPTPYVRADFPASAVPNPNVPQFNYAFPIPETARTGENIYCDPACPGTPGSLAPVLRTINPGSAVNPPGTVLGIRGEVPDGDTLRAAISEDPRTCNGATYPSSLNGCLDFAGTDREITRGTITVDWDAGPVRFKSLSHLATADTSQEEGAEDVSASTSPTVGELHFRTDTDLFSQELRVLSNDDGPVTWAGGVLFWQERTEQHDGSATCFNYSFQPCGPFWRNVVDTGLLPLGTTIPLANPNRVPLNPALWERETTHASVYGLVEWQFLESWKIALEARQTYEELDLQGPTVGNGIFYPTAVPAFFIPSSIGPGTVDADFGGPGGYATVVAGLTSADLGNVDDDFFAPKATLTWTPSDEMLYYFSWGESYKPKGITPFTGGAGAFDPVGNSFDQERLQVWELGTKTTWLDGRLLANATAFFQDFKNKQVSTQVQVGNLLVPRTLNAGAAEVWGAELEFTWIATDNLRFDLAYTWLDTEYTEYFNKSTSAPTISYVNNCADVVATSTVPIATGTYAGMLPSACILDYSGHELEGAPEHSLVGSARYQQPLVGDTDWFVEGNFEFQDERYQDDRNTMIFPSYWMFDFRAGVSNDAWDVIAYVDNAFDDDTIKTGLADGDVPNFLTTNLFMTKGTVILPDPRTYGLRVNYRFGGQ